MNARRISIVVAGLAVISATLVACLPTDTASSVAVALPPLLTDERGWELVFDDQFNGDDLDSRWTTCYWWQTDGGCTISSNDEQQWYQPDGVRVADGVLQLTASAIPQRTTDGTRLPYQSGMVSTGPVGNEGDTAGFTFTYGYVEATVRMPTAEGTWPAVWLLSADRTSLPEIDIVENYGSRPGRFTSRVHQRVDGSGESEGIESTERSRQTGWHTVGVLWTPTSVEFFVDDVSTGSITDSALIPQTPMYLIINLAMGGQAGSVDDAALPQRFEIEAVRVWQQNCCAS